MSYREVPENLAWTSPWDTVKNPLRIALWGRSKINSLIDTFFYDVSGLSRDEREKLLAEARREGAILVVGPEKGVTSYDNIKEFIASKPLELDTIVVAGVGSSSIGTAALARGVAKYLGRPVVGVVSGHGLADVLGEAMGGWFGLGAANLAAHLAADALVTLGPLREEATGWSIPGKAATAGTIGGLDNTAGGYVSGVKDSDVLANILGQVPSIKIIVGHSKGNFVIANALALLKQKPLDLRVLTLGAPAYLPRGVTRHQVIGGLDFFGALNCRAAFGDWAIQPWARHPVNTRVPFALDVAKALEAANIR